MRVRFPPQAHMPKLSRRLAYAVGLITTDGCLYSDQRHISFTSADKQLIQTFNKCLGKSNRITINPRSSLSKSDTFRVQIGDVVLYRWLMKIGLSPNKSLNLGSIKIPDKYFADFLRGHLDGDGSIIKYEDRYLQHLNPKYIYQRLFIYFLSASKRHLIWLRKSITRLTTLSGSLNKKISKSQRGKHQLYVLKFSTKEAKKLLNWIYYKPNLPCLKRKYLIAKEFLD